MKFTSLSLLEKTQTGTDGFGAPVYSEEWVTVDNVLIGSPSTDDIIHSQELYGKKVIYIIGIPKGDTHDWEDTRVRFWGDEYKTFGYPITGIQENIPLGRMANVMVERYG